MTKITICKAAPIGKLSVEDTVIEINGEQPEHRSLEEAGEFFENQAYWLAKALIDSLPGGTLDRLLIRLMGHKVSYYRGSEAK